MLRELETLVIPVAGKTLLQTLEAVVLAVVSKVRLVLRLVLLPGGEPVPGGGVVLQPAPHPPHLAAQGGGSLPAGH